MMRAIVWYNAGLNGSVAEWFKAAVLKTVGDLRPP